MASAFDGFENFDDEEVFTRYYKAVQQPHIQNVVVDFGRDEARAAVDIKTEQWRELVAAERPAACNTRWISIWGPENQGGTLKLLGKHYGFSPRLLGIMCSDRPPQQSEAASRSSSHHYSWRRTKDQGDKLADSENGDIEMRAASSESGASPSRPNELDVSHWTLVDEVWHYSSVDWGDKYLCLGFNSVQSSSETDVSVVHHDHEPRNVPKGKRIWSWLVLCNDGTVISIYEDIFRGAGRSSAQCLPEVLMIRRNLLNVFRQLSKAPAASAGATALSILGIRRSLSSLEGEEPESAEAYNVNVAASLLFHYLFDDWYSSYGLVARQEHQYGRELFKLREKLLARADLADINDLHHVGRQLAVLKRIYQSYKSIIDRILERQKLPDINLISSTGGSRRSQSPSRAADDEHGISEPLQMDLTMKPSFNTNVVAGARGRFGVALAPAAVVRFERLRDRISLYALSEIEDCLDEKESMVFMTFNLIAMKESQAVERLTRITILLAKVTILFLPVSLMTAYFSIDIADLEGVYTHKTYWGCFGVVMALSILLLVGFGMLSDTVEGKMVYRSLSQMLLGATRRVFGRRKAKWS